ncbi:SHOCT domain-containing protein [Aliiroseovarius sp. KMU-50]|uniref:SHOCT domain-containing protein n=1 Tax=Aliiroseovarius salicola TaxID=3009082 RepID=A0ABT4W5V7_9RHOB|nr:SHOCT domain-containing protein [Aliiroseovarius sp. KMU-50]MDA5095779.1 SHOCT domain-containing protein [Aliiroseovarius sp. KMU-50]
MTMRLIATSIAVLSGAAVAYADPAGDWGAGYGHMGWGGGFGMLGGLMMLVFWGVIIALIVIAVRWFADNSSGRSKSSDAMDTLKSRFAKGEIDEDEFRKRKAALED